MYETSLELLSNQEIELFTELFNERCRDNSVFFNDFKEMLYSYDKFESPYLNELIEKVKKKLKERNSGYSDNELILSKILVI
jgi:hypothetical protein